MEFIYEWTDETGMVLSDNSIFEVDSAGNYYLQAIDTINGCSSGLDLVTVSEQVDQPTAIIYANPGNTLDCFIEFVILTYESQPNAIFQWYVNNDLVDSEELII